MAAQWVADGPTDGSQVAPAAPAVVPVEAVAPDETVEPRETPQEQGDLKPGAVDSVPVTAFWNRGDVESLRDRWRAVRGSDLRPFHDAVLGSGSVPLAVLDRIVTERMRGVA